MYWFWWNKDCQSLNIWQSYGGKVDYLKRPVRRGTVLLDSVEMWLVAGRNCCNSATLRLILLNNFDSVIDRSQTGVVSTICYSPTDAICDWTSNVCSGVLSRRLSSWLMDVRTVGHSVGFFGVVTVNIFSEVNRNVANMIGWISLSNCFKWQRLAWKLASLSFGSLRLFEHKHFTR